MKFQLLFFLVLAVVATFIITETETAPSKKQHGAKHELFKASQIKLWTQQFGQFLQNGKGQEQKTRQVAPTFIKNAELTRAIENPALLKLFHYLTWLSDLDLYDFYYELGVLLGNPLIAFWDFAGDLHDALESVDVDVDDLFYAYFAELEDDFIVFLDDGFVFWSSWLLDPEHIRENLLIHIPQIQSFFRSFGTKTFNHFINLLDLCQILLTPQAYTELMDKIQIALDTTGVAIDKLKAALKPPTDIVPPPTNVTLEGLLGVFPYIAELNVSSIILDGLSTAQQLKGLRLTFDKDLVTLFGEASADGADSDLESQGQNITGNFEAAVDNRYTLNRLALDNFLYAWYYEGGSEFWYAGLDLFYSHFDGLREVPPLAVETIVQLEGLVETLSPEYQQRASDLVTQALQKSDSLIKKYLEVFKPKENKN